MKNHNVSKQRIRLSKTVGLSALVIALTGCAVTTVPLTSSDVRARVNADQFKIYSDQEPVFKPIGFNEALARSLKYNLDYRLKLMESSLAMGLADVTRFEMLPSLVASAGYGTRNNDSGGTSIGIETGIPSLIPSSSSERSHGTSGLELSWNMLDFGVGYFRAQQQADQVLIAEERRRRVVQNILQDVRSAYWRAVGAQRLSRNAEELMERANQALARSREAEILGLVSPKDALGYQRLLLDALQLLTARRQELEFAKRELSALMNFTPGSDFQVVEEAETELLPVPVNVAELEELALLNRPELREEDLRVRVTAIEAKRQMAAMLPNLSLNLGAQYDSNRYLYNNSWVDSSARVTFNMFRVLSMPSLKRAHTAQTANDEARRLALSMAVLTQVRVAIERYRLTQNDLKIARDSNLVDQRLATFARAASSTRMDSELEVIRAETRALNSEYQRYAAYAAAQSAYGRIYGSLGLDVVPDGLEGASLADIGQKVARHLAQVEAETFVRFTEVTKSLPPLQVRFEGLQVTGAIPAGLEAAATAAVKNAAQRVLSRNQVALESNGNTHTLRYKLVLEDTKNGVRRGQWAISLSAPDGKLLGQTAYSSTLTVDPSPRSVDAFTEAATISTLRSLGGWMQSNASK